MKTILLLSGLLAALTIDAAATAAQSSGLRGTTSYVVIERSGEVIPYVVEVHRDKRPRGA